MAGADGDDSLYPIAVLIDELRNEDVQVLTAHSTSIVISLFCGLSLRFFDASWLAALYATANALPVKASPPLDCRAHPARQCSSLLLLFILNCLLKSLLNKYSISKQRKGNNTCRCIL